jgi:hypothetical protein
MFRKLGRARSLLAAKKFKNVPGRDQLVAAASQLRLDVRTLKRAVACPADVTTDMAPAIRSGQSLLSDADQIVLSDLRFGAIFLGYGTTQWA